MIIQVTGSIPANSTDDNVIQGSQCDFFPGPCELEFGLVGSAAGLLADVRSGQDILCEGMAISTQNRFPVFPDDYRLTGVVGPNERIKVRLRNSTRDALTYFVGIRVTPIV
jgi:hypothetical protein